MQLLKSFIALLLIGFSLPLLADKEIVHERVNFYTLSSAQIDLDGSKISVRGWIGFYDYSSSKKVLLFPSQDSKKTFNLDESIELIVPLEDFETTREYLSGKLVNVYGTYNSKQDSKKYLFGTISKIDDIDIVNLD